MTLQEAIKATEKAAWDYAKAMRANRSPGWFNSTEQAELSAATVVQVGRVEVKAGIGGNSRRQHCRHTFKVDGKRATYAEASALEITAKIFA